MIELTDNEDDYNLFGQAVGIVGGACMASTRELQKTIESINSIIGTEYYDGEGDILLKQVVEFLKSKLE